MFIPIADYAPDIANLNESASSLIQNVFPDSNGVKPINDLVPLPDSPSFTDTAQDFLKLNTIWAWNKSSNQTLIFAGSRTSLYLKIAPIPSSPNKEEQLGWRNISRLHADFSPVHYDNAGNILPTPDREKQIYTDEWHTSYHVNPEQGWEFTVFGDTVIAVNAGDKPQILDYSEMRFRDILSAPFASHVNTAGYYVFLSGLVDNPNSIAWSATGDPEYWNFGFRNSDQQTFYQGGNVMGVFGLTSPYVICQEAIYRLNLTSDTTIFTSQLLFVNQGTYIPHSLCQADGTVYFIGREGFYSLSSNGLQRIGFDKVDQQWANNFNKQGFDTRISAVADTANHRIFWTVSSFLTENNLPDYSLTQGGTLCYDYLLNKWSFIVFQGISVCLIPQKGWSLEDLNKFWTSIETVPITLDAAYWKAERSVLAFLNNFSSVSLMAGDNAEATVDTAKAGDTSRNLIEYNGITPVIDTENYPVSISIGQTNKMGNFSELTFLPPKPQSQTDGEVKCLIRCRHSVHRITIPKSSVWTKIQGTDLTFLPSGNR